MGDVVLQTAIVNWLRSLFEQKLRITFLTSSEFSSLLKGHSGIDQVIDFDRRNGEKWKELKDKIKLVHKEHPIDLILDLHATLRSFRLKLSFWHIPTLTVDKRRWERFLLTKLRSKSLKRFFDKKFFGLGPQVERTILDFQDLFYDQRGIYHTQDFRQGPHKEMTSLGELPVYAIKRPYIVVAPSASFFYKRWPVSKFLELTYALLEKTTFNVVLLAGPGDDFCKLFDEIHNERFINLQGKTSLKESMSILSCANLSIGNDSGMNHIAEAYGVPCLTLFGPTDPRFGFSPHGDKSRFIFKELYCQPCSTTGKKKCFRDRHYCMEEISVSEVLNLSLDILEIR